MFRPTRVAAVLSVFAAAPAAWSAQQEVLTDSARDLLRRKPGLQVYVDGDVIRSFYGTPITMGDNPFESAERFRLAESHVFGVTPEQLRPGSLLGNGAHSQPMMYDPDTGTYRMTAVYYRQYVGDIPVFRSDLRLVIRNEIDHPLVLAKNYLRPLGDFTTNGVAAPNIEELARETAVRMHPELQDATFLPLEKTIWAGYESVLAPEPRLAVILTGRNAEVPSSWMMVIDAETGGLLYEESLMHDIDVNGSVEGIATEGTAADICEDHSAAAMPYLLVSIDGAGSAYTDINGNYTISHGGSSGITVRSEIRGQYFVVDNFAGAEAVLTQIVTPPGPADFLHNPTDTETVRAQVDAYISQNEVRDYILGINPAYPVVATETEFQVVVNRNDGFCPNNAWYDSAVPSTNYCISVGSGPNMAWSSVVYHEYGHHLVNVGGSGQCEYGEGMSDCIGILVTDESGTGFGFQGNCAAPLRDGDNTCQYSAGSCTTNCGGPCHSCGRLLSGCVWSTRENLLASNSLTYRQILGGLTLNSILLHNGSSITPQIAIDFLTLDDNDGNIANGTPHYAEICAGFGDHGMDCPVLEAFYYEYPAGLPSMVEPATPTEVVVDILPLAGSVDPSSVQLAAKIGENGFFVFTDMTQVGPDQFAADLPATPCTETVYYYFLADADGGGSVTDPPDAPNTLFSALSAVGLDDYAAFDFETDAGWTVSGTATDGQWDRGVPIPNCDRGNPVDDYDNSGACWLTDNSSANACNSDVDGGATILTSPDLDLSSATDPSLTYARWFSNTEGASPNQDTMVMEISDNGGISWTPLETVGPAGPEADGGWNKPEFRVLDYVALTSNVRVRFIVSDNEPGSVVEAAVDDFQIFDVVCAPLEEPPTVTAQPEDADVCQTEDASFSVTASGSGPFTYQWFKDDVAMSGEESSTLNIVSAEVGDEGDYRCEVGNVFGTTSSLAASLNVVETVECDDSNACTVDSCAVATCINTDTTPAGQCCDPADGALLEISDADACTTDVCNPDGSVSHSDNYDVATQCCNSATGAIQQISDDNDCTDDTCNPDGSVAHVDNYDTGTECCNPSGGAVLMIDDGDDCTADACNTASGEVTYTVAAPAAAGVGPRTVEASPAACTGDVALRVTSPDWPCLDLYVDTDGSLTVTPVFQSTAAWSNVVLLAEEIVPDSTYEISTETVGGVVSDPTSAQTWIWGDVNNNGTANFEDVLLIVNVFQGDTSDATEEATDLEPCQPNGTINLADVQRGVQAFQGDSYADTGCPLPCP